MLKIIAYIKYIGNFNITYLEIRPVELEFRFINLLKHYSKLQNKKRIVSFYHLIHVLNVRPVWRNYKSKWENNHCIWPTESIKLHSITGFRTTQSLSLHSPFFIQVGSAPSLNWLCKFSTNWCICSKIYYKMRRNLNLLFVLFAMVPKCHKDEHGHVF